MTRTSFLNRILCAVVITLGCFLLARSTARQTPVCESQKPKPIEYVAPTRENDRKLADEVDATLQRHVLDVWFPLTADNENGGFRADFNREWKPGEKSGASSPSFKDA